MFLAVFDFDHTVMEGNTDVQVQSICAPDPLPSSIRQVARDKGWTSFMEAVFLHLHSIGKGKEDILESMDKMEFAPGMLNCLKQLKALGGDLIIISDSNTVFIDRILETHQIGHLFTSIFTNPAHFDQDEVLRIKPFHKNNSCRLSSSNLCKGRVLTDYLTSKSNQSISYDFVVYAGDGKNDFCPMLRLQNNDVAYARKGDNFAIEKHIERQQAVGHIIKSEVVFWTEGDDIITHLRGKLKKECAKNY